MESVFIDPAMLMLQDEDIIEKNIDFFRKIIALSNSRQISLCLYKEIIEHISTRQIYPFPININDVKNKELKEKLLLLNNSFTTSIMNNYQEVDIDNCQGSQEFTTDRKDYEERNEYYAFFGMLLTSCYASYNISDKILVGEKTKGILEGEQIIIYCNCESREYEKTYIWISPDDYLTEQQKAIEHFRAIIKGNNKLFVTSPEVKRANHHNHVQNTEFNCYEQLTAKNKRVFNYLRYLGLYRIIFENFAPDTSYEVGTIKIVKVDQTADSDIITGWFYGCVDFKTLVEMYFPKDIGTTLVAYAQGEISRIKMEELKTELVLY